MLLQKRHPPAAYCLAGWFPLWALIETAQASEVAARHCIQQEHIHLMVSDSDSGVRKQLIQRAASGLAQRLEIGRIVDPHSKIEVLGFAKSLASF